jgi:hypothetical protein
MEPSLSKIEVGETNVVFWESKREEADDQESQSDRHKSNVKHVQQILMVPQRRRQRANYRQTGNLAVPHQQSVYQPVSGVSPL